MLTRRQRVETSGFSLPEMLTVLALIAILVAVTYPALKPKVDESRAAALAKTLDGISESVNHYRGNVGRLPKTLAQLTTKPSTGAPDLCGNVVPDVNINQWRGPYSSRTFVSPGIRVADATIKDTLRRVPSTNTSTPFGVLYVDVKDTDSSVAALLERQFDGDVLNYSTGTLQWQRAAAPPAGPIGQVSFGIPVRGC